MPIETRPRISIRTFRKDSVVGTATCLLAALAFHHFAPDMEMDYGRGAPLPTPVYLVCLLTAIGLSAIPLVVLLSQKDKTEALLALRSYMCVAVIGAVYVALPLSWRIYYLGALAAGVVASVGLCVKSLARRRRTKILCDRSGAYLRSGALDDARAVLDRAIELDPRSAVAHAARGIVRLRQGDTAGADDDAQKAVDLDPRCAHAYDARGRVRRMLGEYELAVQDLSRAIALRPGYGAAFAERALAYNALGMPDKVMADLAQAERFGVPIRPPSGMPRGTDATSPER